GFTALHAAILRSDAALVRALLDRGANPNLRMTKGTPKRRDSEDFNIQARRDGGPNPNLRMRKGTPKRRDSEDFNLQAPLIGTTPYLLAAKFVEPEILPVLKKAVAA